MHVIDSRVLDGESSCTKQWDFRDPSILADFLIAKCVSDLNSANIENLKADTEGPRPSIFSVDLYRFDIDLDARRASSVRSLMMDQWSAFALSEEIDLFKETVGVETPLLQILSHLMERNDFLKTRSKASPVNVPSISFDPLCAPIQVGCKAEVCFISTK